MPSPPSAPKLNRWWGLPLGDFPEADLGFPPEGALSGMQQGGKESLKYDPARDRTVITIIGEMQSGHQTIWAIAPPLPRQAY